MAENTPFPWRSPQTAEMEAELKRGPLVDPVNAMSDQAIRAHALECTTRMWATTNKEVAGDPDLFMENLKRVFWADVHEFEAYIRDGVT